MMERIEYSAAAAAARIDYVSHQEPLTAKKKKSKNKNKKRFSDEQIRSLESIFETETKLEPRKKVQLARELGLQPRQIAIWFQNRRARWKSKQIEQEYKVLKANYDNLASQFEFLMKEKQSLLIQLQKLSDLLEKRQDGSRSNKNLEGNSMDDSSDDRETKFACEAKPNFLQKLDQKGFVSPQDVRSKNIGYCEEEGREVLNLDCSLASVEKLCNFESGGLIDQPSGNLHWWNVWT